MRAAPTPAPRGAAATAAAVAGAALAALTVGTAPLQAQPPWPVPPPSAVEPLPRPTPVSAVERAAEVPRATFASAGAEGANTHIRIEVRGVAEEAELGGERAPEGETFVVLSTLWENIHPMVPVREAPSAYEGRTMGVSGFASGRSSDASRGRIIGWAEVPFVVPRMADHVYLGVDGRTFPLHPATAGLPRGVDPDDGVGIGSAEPESGDAGRRSARALALAFRVPASGQDVALRVFDYHQGHVTVPLRGDPERALASTMPDDAVDRVTTDVIDLALVGLGTPDVYRGVPAPDGRKWAVVRLVGMSRSAGGGVGDIVQLDPAESAWLTWDGGFAAYAAAGSLDDAGRIRFTPGVPQPQELAFLVPADAARFRLGVRLTEGAVTLDATRQPPEGFPDGDAVFEDGDVMQVHLLGMRASSGGVIVDLGIRSRLDQGIELQAAQQLLMVTGAGQIRPDLDASRALTGGPPDPFVVPPGAEVRFRLVYPGVSGPAPLRVRGFRGEGRLEP